uniref:Uncharacterized protein n=1 Tax=viral metagenome TaxID=1070528 RepID=A0A6C0C9Y2_9ZZZZ
MFSYCLAAMFDKMGTTLCTRTMLLQKKMIKKFGQLEIDEKLYFNKYASHVAGGLFNYLGDINLYETNNIDEELHDIRLSTDNGESFYYISLSHADIKIKDIIPDKLAKIYNFKKKSDNHDTYTEEYDKLNKKMYKQVRSFDKFSEVPTETKNDELFEPTCDLVLSVIDDNQERAKYLYSHLFSEDDRIVLKLLKSRFVIYDFGIKTVKHITSCETEKEDQNKIILTFNNQTNFILTLGTNASDVKEHISLKFKTKFKNMDGIYCVHKGTV